MPDPEPANTHPGKDFDFEIDFTSSETYHGSELELTLMGFTGPGLLTKPPTAK